MKKEDKFMEKVEKLLIKEIGKRDPTFQASLAEQTEGDPVETAEQTAAAVSGPSGVATPSRQGPSTMVSAALPEKEGTRLPEGEPTAPVESKSESLAETVEQVKHPNSCPPLEPQTIRERVARRGLRSEWRRVSPARGSSHPKLAQYTYWGTWNDRWERGAGNDREKEQRKPRYWCTWDKHKWNPRGGPRGRGGWGDWSYWAEDEREQERWMREVVEEIEVEREVMLSVESDAYPVETDANFRWTGKGEGTQREAEKSELAEESKMAGERDVSGSRNERYKLDERNDERRNDGPEDENRPFTS